MGEIVWAKTIERREGLEHHTYGVVPADTRMTIFASKDKVALVDATMLIGANRNSDKKYYAWQSVSSMGFFRNRAGNLQPYRAIRPLKQKVWKSYYPETSFYYLEENDEVAGRPMKEFRDACNEYLRLRSVYDLYPMAEVMDMPARFNLLPANLRPYMRTTDWNQYLVSAFGKNRVTPSFVKAAQKTEPYVLSLAYEFRGLIPDKTLLKFIQNTQFSEELMEGFKPHTPKIRRVLRALDERSRLRLIGEPLTIGNTLRIKTVSDRFATTNPFPTRKVFIRGSIDTWDGLTRGF